MPKILDSDNHLFTLARRGRRVPSTFAAIALVPVLLTLMIASQVWMRVLFRPLLGEGQAADDVAELLGFSSIFAGLWGLLHFWSKRPFWSLGFERAGSARYVLRGALLAATMMAVTTALVMIPGAVIGPGEIQRRGVAALGGGLLTFLATGAQSSAEESLFRGWLLTALGARYGALTGVVVSSLVFTLAHATTGPTLVGWANLFLFGTAAALLVLAEGGLWGACAWHAVWNWVEGGLLGFSVDRTLHKGLLASIQTKGPDYIAGGAFGPEGGLAVTAVLLGGIAMLVVVTRRKTA